MHFVDDIIEVSFNQQYISPFSLKFKFEIKIWGHNLFLIKCNLIGTDIVFSI